MNPPPCRYWARGGACRHGAACAFSHDTAVAQALAIPCVYYARGFCQYGTACRFDHVKQGGGGTAPQASPSAPVSTFAPPSTPAWTPGDVTAAHLDPDELEVLAELEALGLAGVDDGDDGDDVARVVEAGSGSPPPTSAGLCGAFIVSGRCAKGDACRHTHGDLCDRCGRYSLHPTRLDERAAHDAECAARAARIAELATSATIECGICLEVVLDKARAADRRFGLLACDHAFCLPCIRSWRGNAASGFDVEGAVRACPICRTRADFVTPSATWPASEEARAAVISAYKAAVATIECRHWDRGRGTCPFGTSCHYAHLDEAGAPVDRSTGLRFVGGADGTVKPMAGVRLSDFLTAGGSAGARRVMGGRGR